MVRKLWACWSSNARLSILFALGLLSATVATSCGESNNVGDGGMDASVGDCDEGRYGADCEGTCGSCGNGTCNDGREGNGACVCNTGFTGAQCAACAPGFYGASCTACACGANGTCADGMTGDGTCTCDANFEAPTCADCVEGYFGATCSGQCSDCGAGTCSDGVAGTGLCECPVHSTGAACDACAAGYYGPQCAGECDCSSGVCNEGITGDGTCACIDGFLGERCDRQARTCLEIKQANPNAESKVYSIDPDGTGAIDVYCDMTTAGGGWMLVLNYVRAASTSMPLNDPNVDANATAMPQLGSSTLGDDETGEAHLWGHARPSLLNRFMFTELRFYAESSFTGAPPRRIHFMTAAPNCNAYFRTGNGSCNDITGLWTPLEDHTANLFGAYANNLSVMRYASNQGNNAMTNEPFHVDNGDGFACAFSGSRRWEADDMCRQWGPTNDGANCTIANSLSHSTIHRIWVR